MGTEMSEDQARIAALEQRLDALVETFEKALPQLATKSDLIRNNTEIIAATHRIAQLMSTMEATQRKQAMQALALITVQDKQEATDQRQAATDQRQAATDARLLEVLKLQARFTPSASLLATYEELVAPTGQSLRSWMVEMDVLDRYRSVVALRARREKAKKEDTM